MRRRLLTVIGLMIIICVPTFTDVKSDYAKKDNEKDSCENIEKNISNFKLKDKEKEKEYYLEAKFMLGMCYYKLENNFPKAKENFLSSLKNEVDSSEQTLKALYFLHTIAITENDENLAEKYLLDMKKRTKEKDPDVFERSGKFYLYVKNDYVKAEEEFNKSVTLDPKKEIYYMALIGLYEMKQDEEKVNEFTSKMKEINPKIKYIDMAVYFEQENNYVLASKYYSKSILIDKNDISKIKLGVMIYNFGKKEDGKKLLQQAQKEGIKDADKVLEEIAKEEAKK